jgi:uncharacterized protein YdaU (DUF1376 family)
MLAAVADCSAEEIGAFMWLAGHQDLHGALPADDAAFAEIARSPTLDQWKMIRTNVMALLATRNLFMFPTDPNAS